MRRNILIALAALTVALSGLVGASSASASSYQWFAGYQYVEQAYSTNSLMYRTYAENRGTTAADRSWQVNLYTSGGAQAAHSHANATVVYVNYSGPYNTNSSCGRWDYAGGSTYRTCTYNY
ncbi:MAG: hypothetical protein JWL76_375 [Thermoleophilia bacterium]|nr:hypothetical protein [Thermoleophilia bacterium]